MLEIYVFYVFIGALWNPKRARRNAECLLNVMRLVCEQCLVARKEKQTVKKGKT